MSGYSGEAYYYLVILGLYEPGCCIEKSKIRHRLETVWGKGIVYMVGGPWILHEKQDAE